MSRVVNIHLLNGMRPAFDVYIGRRVRFHSVFTEDSKWANHYGRTLDSLEKYEEHIRKTPDLWNALDELDDKVLGCWCIDTNSEGPPFYCHGQVLIRLVREKKEAEGK